MKGRYNTKSKWESVNRRTRRRGTKEEYDSFDKYLNLKFSYDTPTKKEVLSDKMQVYGFHVYEGEYLEPTDKQLDYAWDFILKHYLPKQKEITDYYNVETTGISHITRKPNYRYRATRNIIYKNKKYRKGQFMPKQEMLDIE